MGKLKKVYCLMGYTAVGKSTIAKKITQEIEDLHLAVSHTTRPIRPNEKEGIDYYFIDDKKFEKITARIEISCIFVVVKTSKN